MYKFESKPTVVAGPRLSPAALVYRTVVYLDAECFHTFWGQIEDACITQRIQSYDPYDAICMG